MSSEYRPLPGNFQLLRAPGRGVSLGFIGEDHLLLIETTAFHERIHRLFFEDILAVTVTEHPEHLAWSGLSIFGFLLFTAATLAAGRSRVYLVLCCCFSLAFALLGFVNLWLGPACRCRVLTPGGWRPLRVWDRWRYARPGLAFLTQSVLPLQTRLAGQDAPGLAVPDAERPPEAPQQPSAGPAPSLQARIWFWRTLGIASALFLTGAAYDASAFMLGSLWSDLASGSLRFCAGVCVVALLPLSLKVGRRKLLVALVACLGLALQVGFSEVMDTVLVLHHAGESPLLEASRLADPAVRTLFVARAMVGLLLSLGLGWAFLVRRRAA